MGSSSRPLGLEEEEEGRGLREGGADSRHPRDRPVFLPSSHWVPPTHSSVLSFKANFSGVLSDHPGLAKDGSHFL